MYTRHISGWTLGVIAIFNTGAWTQQTTLSGLKSALSDHVASASTGQVPDKDLIPQNISRRRRCRAEKMFLAGAEAMKKNDPRTAEKDFVRANELDPSNRQYLLSAEFARQSTVSQLIQQAKKEKQLRHKNEFLIAIQEVLRLDPQNPMVTGLIETLGTDASAQPATVHIASSEASTPIELMPAKGQHTFYLRTAAYDMIRQVLNAYGIQATIDASVRDRIVHFSADNVDFAESADLVRLVTGTFFVPLDTLHVLVLADTKENRSKYERQVMETIYLSGLDASELNDMANIARNIFGAEHAVIQAGENTMTVRMQESDLAALNETYAELLGGRSELQLEVRLYEIEKTKATNVGVVLPSSVTMFNVPSELNSVLQNNASLIQQLLASDPALAGNYAGILAALIASGALSGTVFNNPFAVFGGGLTLTGIEWNATSVNMLLNSADTRSLDQLQLRVLDQEEATIRSGERYPIMISSYSGLAGSSSSSSTIPQIQYEDLGLTLKVKPHIESETAISLNLNLKVASLAGSTINNIPVLNDRQYTGVVSMRPGDSVMVASTISKQDSLEITGVPGLNDIPGFGTTNRQNTQDIMELVILITPHIVRLAHRKTMGPMLMLSQH